MEKRRVGLTMISAETECDLSDCENVVSAGNTAALLVKLLRSMARNTSGSINAEAFSYASNLLEELKTELKQVGLDEENLRLSRNLEKVCDFATLKLMELKRRTKLRDRDGK